MSNLPLEKVSESAPITIDFSASVTLRPGQCLVIEDSSGEAIMRLIAIDDLIQDDPAEDASPEPAPMNPEFEGNIQSFRTFDS